MRQRSKPPIFAPPSAGVRVGVARRDITPPVGIYNRNWGAAKHDFAAGVHKPLTATVLAIRSETSDEPLLLVVLDAGWWQRAEDEWFVRGPLIESLKLDPARVMVSLTHTHAGPSLCREDADKPGGQFIESHLRSVRNIILATAREALANPTRATLTWATGRCDLAANRDLPDPDADRILCGFNPSNPADDTLLVGRLCESTGRVIATLVNYACHPTTLAWDNRLLSPDYVGATRQVVEKQTGGAPCLFLQGASGELAPREQYTGDTSVADANGRRLGAAVVATLEMMLPPRTALTYAGAVESGAPLATWERRPFDPPGELEAVQFDVELPLKPLPSEHEVCQELAGCDDRALTERLRRKLRVLRTVGGGPTCNMPAWVWRIGQSVIVAQPNEAYSAFQIALRRRFPGFAVAVVNLVNGSCGYLAPPELHDRDIYQVWQSPFAREGLPRLIETCERRIKGLIES